MRSIASFPVTPQQEYAIIDKHQSWLDKNPDLYYIVEHDGEVVGYTSIIPLKPEKIKEILDSKELSINVSARKIQTRFY